MSTNTAQYPEDAQHGLPPGTLISHYLLHRVLGVGGFAVTYLAIDQHDQREVAIKEYMPSFARRDSQGKVVPRGQKDQDDFAWGFNRFVEEARLLGEFDHPNLNRIEAVCYANATVYMVLEYIEGQTLAEQLKKQNRLPEAMLMSLIHPLLDALQMIHDAALVHRDIKPANIMIRPNGSPVLLDFGAARPTGSQHSQLLTTVLTPGYSPIEQYDQLAEDFGPWTDLYALGMVLYRCVTGCGDREIIDAVARGRAVMRGHADPMQIGLKNATAGYSKPFVSALAWAMRVPERKRPQSVGQWRGRLQTGGGKTRAWLRAALWTSAFAAILAGALWLSHGVNQPPTVVQSKLAVVNQDQKPVPHKPVGRPLKQAPPNPLWTVTGHHDTASHVTFLPTGQPVSASGDNTIKIWNRNGQLLHRLTGHKNSVSALAVSRDGQWVVSGSWDHTLKLWSSHSGELIRTMTAHQGKIGAVAINQFNVLVSAGADGSIALWRMDASLRSRLDTQSAVTSLVFSPNGHLLLSGHTDHSIRVWDIQELRLLRELRVHSSAVQALAFAPDGIHFLSADANGVLLKWLLGRNQPQWSGKAHHGSIHAIAMAAPDVVLSAADDGYIKAWQLDNGRPLWKLMTQNANAGSLAVHADTMVGGSRQGDITVWQWQR